jgi:hypothetical protein
MAPILEIISNRGSNMMGPMVNLIRRQAVGYSRISADAQSLLNPGHNDDESKTDMILAVCISNMCLVIVVVALRLGMRWTLSRHWVLDDSENTMIETMFMFDCN